MLDWKDGLGKVGWNRAGFLFHSLALIFCVVARFSPLLFKRGSNLNWFLLSLLGEYFRHLVKQMVFWEVLKDAFPYYSVSRGKCLSDSASKNSHSWWRRLHKLILLNVSLEKLMVSFTILLAKDTHLIANSLSPVYCRKLEIRIAIFDSFKIQDSTDPLDWLSENENE